MSINKKTARVGFGGKHPVAGEKLTVFEKKELKAYMKGQRYFYHGKSDLDGSPIPHIVREIRN